MIVAYGPIKGGKYSHGSVETLGKTTELRKSQDHLENA